MPWDTVYWMHEEQTTADRIIAYTVEERGLNYFEEEVVARNSEGLEPIFPQMYK